MTAAARETTSTSNRSELTEKLLAGHGTIQVPVDADLPGSALRKEGLR